MADSAFKIKDGDGTYRSVTSFLAKGNIKSTGQTFHNASYFSSDDTQKYVIYRQPDGVNWLQYIWSDARSIVGTYYRRAGSTTTPDFARRGWAPTFDDGSSWTPTATTSQIKYVSGTGLQYRNSTSGSWTTLSNTINSPIVIIETQGGGGGGGGACVNAGNANTHNYSGGGGGASGVYIAHVVDLSDGVALTLVKGSGGAAGSNAYEASGSGGSRGTGSYVQKNGTTIIAAPGGPGGKAATHSTGKTTAGGQSDLSVYGDCTYITGTASTATTAYANELSMTLGAKGGSGAGNNESSKLSGYSGSSSSNSGLAFARSVIGSAGGGGQGSNCTGLTKCSCGGGGGGSVLGNGGGGAKVYQSGSYWYHAQDGGAPGVGGGGGGGSYGWDGSNHRSGGPYKGGDGQIKVQYQTSYKHPS